MSNFDLFPASYDSIRTHDSQLTSLLQAINAKVNETINKPWSKLQRHPGALQGITSIHELAAALRTYRVALPMSDLMFLYASYPLNVAGEPTPRFDWGMFVANLFPTENGELVAPRPTGARLTEHRELAQRQSFARSVRLSEDGSEVYRNHPPAVLSPNSQLKFFGTGSGSSWTNIPQPLSYAPPAVPAFATNPANKHLTQLVYPRDAPLPPANVLSRTVANVNAHQNQPPEATQVSIAQELSYRGSKTAQALALKAKLQSAFEASRNGHAEQQAGVGAGGSLTARPVSSSSSSFPFQRTRVHLSPGASNRNPNPGQGKSHHEGRPLPAHQEGSQSARYKSSFKTPPTYMLPVPHRTSRTDRARLAREQQQNIPTYAHSVNGKYEPYPDSVRTANGERVPKWSQDTYTVPSIQFGQPFRF